MKILKTIKNAFLCIKYPFLYPRNRFTGLHYNNWEIAAFHRRWWKYTQDFFHFNITTESYSVNIFHINEINDKHYRVFRSQNEIIMQDSEKIIFRKPVSYFGDGEVRKVGWFENKLYIVVKEGWKDNPDCNHFFTYNHTKWLRFIINSFDWINKYLLQIFHCLPDHTEWDALEPGWRKAFGDQLLKELRKQLVKDKLLYKWRITQIKEKWGYLHLYCAPYTDGIYDIISKYEKISAETCIRCGKPATHMSKGWICPYCDDCHKQD